MLDSEQILDPKDFVALKFSVSFENLTSRTKLSPESASLEEMGKSSVILGLPDNCCSTEHSVMIKISQIGPGAPAKATPFVATGKVTEIEAAADQRVRALISLVQYDEQSWKTFHAIFLNRQDEINKFIAAVKG